MLFRAATCTALWSTWNLTFPHLRGERQALNIPAHFILHTAVCAIQWAVRSELALPLPLPFLKEGRVAVTTSNSSTSAPIPTCSPTPDPRQNSPTRLATLLSTLPLAPLSLGLRPLGLLLALLLLPPRGGLGKWAGLSLPTALIAQAARCPFPVPKFPMVTNLLVLMIIGLWKSLRFLKTTLNSGQHLLATRTK